MSSYNLKEPVWKNIGVTVDEKLTSHEIVKMAGADYTVSKKPVFITVPTNNPDENAPKIINKEVKGFFATYRKDTGHPFAVVKSKYEVVQNREVFSFLDGLVAESDIKFESCGIYNEGASIFVTLRLPDYINVGGKDDVVTNYLVVTNSHDGSSSIRVLYTPIRMACMNALQAARTRAESSLYIKHTKNAKDRVAHIPSIMKMYNTKLKYVSELYNQMANVHMTDKEINMYLVKTILSNEEYVIEQNKAIFTDELSVRKMNLIKDIFNYTYTGIGQNMESSKNTLWGAYNGITGYYQNAKYTNSAEDDIKKFNSNLFGANSGIMHRALALAANITSLGKEALSKEIITH